MSAPALSRREFLQVSAAGAAGLVLSFYLPLSAEDKPPAITPNTWLKIDPLGEVSLWVARSEMGQGVRTSMAMILAEELEADWSRVRIVQADLDPKYGDQVTGGSGSVRRSWLMLRKAGAAARDMLRAAAAEKWRVPVSECVAREGAVVHAPSRRRLGYGELATKAATMPVPQDPPLKDAKDFRIVGTPVARVDGPRIVTGTAQYGLDFTLPGMLYAAIARPSVFGARVKSFKADAAKRVPGVRQVVEVPRTELPVPFEGKRGGEGHQHFLWGGVAVVADSTWAALQGRRALEVEWDDGPAAAESTGGMRSAFQDAAAHPGQVVHNDGDAAAVFERAARKVEAVYELPFLAHAPMEPPSCTALVRDGRCEIWGPMQNPAGVQAALKLALGLPDSAITIHITLLGGGFGRRLNIDFPTEAALVSRAVNAPVKVVWTREDDLAHDYYRQASYHHMRAGLDEQNRVVAWWHHIVSPSTDAFYEGQASPDDGGAQIVGPGMPAGTVPNFRVDFTHVPSAVPRGWWRAVDLTFTTFVVQAFIDELAATSGKDPLALRRELIGPDRPPDPNPGRVDPARLRRVFDLAAEKAKWGSPLPPGKGRGIAGVFGWGSYVAYVAEVSVNSGAVRVERVVAAVDCGQVVNPDMVAAQVEGGIVFGLSAALKGEITVKRGRVQQSNFDDYPVLRINEMPQVEVHILPRTAAPGGMGEPPVPAIAPAVTNAIFAATGKRVRRLPIRRVEM
jgi:isoquinoline 1-oxidoreductase beta subunit